MPKPPDKRATTPQRTPARASRDQKPWHAGPKRAARANPAQRLVRASPDVIWIYGTHAVHAALTAGKRKLIRLHATSQAAENLSSAITASAVTLAITTNEEISASLGADAVHQGLLLEARAQPDLDLSEIVLKSGIILVLDQITDPHNVGAIVRNAAAFGVDALVTTQRHAPDFSGVLAKAASGGLEYVPLVTVTNLARALDELRETGFQCIGLDSEASTDLDQAPLQAPLALVLGAEGHGLRRLTRERCDFLARLDLPGAIKSLNVSNASAIALALTHRRLRALL